MVRRPKLPKQLAVANGDTVADRDEVALASVPYPGWTAEGERRRGAKARVHDKALGKIERYLDKTKTAKIDFNLVHKIARDFDPDRLLAKGGLAGGLQVRILIVDEDERMIGVDVQTVDE